MEFTACAFALSWRNLPFMEFTGVTELHDAAILHLFRLGANYQRPMDLPYTTGLCWREGIYRCLGSFRSRVKTSPLVSPLAPPSSSLSPLVPSSSSSSPLVPSGSSSVQLSRAPTRVRAARAPPTTESQRHLSTHESQRFQSAPKSWSRPAHLCLRWSRPAHLCLRWSRPAHLCLRWSRPAHLCLRWSRPAHIRPRWHCPVQQFFLGGATHQSPLIHHGRLSPLIHHGRLSSQIHHGRPNSLLRLGSRNGHRSGGHLSGFQVPPLLPIGCYTAQDAPIT